MTHTMRSILGGTAMVTTLGLAACGGSDEGPDEFGAKDVCHQAVEEQLKAPATAEYGNETVEVFGDKHYVIEGTVDAENGFGAMLRLKWVCKASWVSGTNWSPVEATVLES